MDNTENKIDIVGVKWSERSESIQKIAQALVKAQALVLNAKKDTKNEFFKSRYADLASVKDAMQKAFADHELAVLQEPSTDSNHICLITTLLHASGEFMRSKLVMPVKDQTAQAYGSAITYARRYALSAIAGVAPDDDDGNAASGAGNGAARKPDAQRVVPSLKSANELQQEAAKKVFKDDDIAPDVKPSGIYTYDLKSYFEGLEPKQYNYVMRGLEQKQALKISEGVYQVPEFLDGLKDYLLSSSVTEAA